MPQLLGPNGRPISTKPQNKKVAPPILGESFGAWAGRDREFMTLPGGGVVQFDLSKLTVQDFRNMRDHYQVNASLAVLSFMQHQSDFHVRCEDKRIEAEMDTLLHDNWTQLNRAMSQANWAGYSPNALQWENQGRSVVLDKVKDLVPEECEVKWETVDGWAPPGRTPPKFKIYDGIKQIGSPYPIPVENSFWYPLLMENGDYYGRKLLRPAFTSYFFSILVHLFSNRYYERFGEPVPVGRAPFDDDITVEGETIAGNRYMLNVLRDLRNRSVIVLPNDKSQFGNETSPSFDYDLEYLESQMRGADFERYLTRLDEEISIGLFTPILLLRTADVGSYNLGVGHMQMYLWMLNAMNDDRKLYLDKYILSKATDYNFGPNAPRAKVVFRKLGGASAEMIKEILTALTQRGSIDFDYQELGQIAGMTIEQIEQTVDTPSEPGDDGDAEPAPSAPDAPVAVARRPSGGSASDTAKAITERVGAQVASSFKDGSFGPGLRVNMGFKKRMEKALSVDGVADAKSETDRLYAVMDEFLDTVISFGTEEFSDAESVTNLFKSKLQQELDITTSKQG